MPYPEGQRLGEKTESQPNGRHVESNGGPTVIKAILAAAATIVVLG